MTNQFHNQGRGVWGDDIPPSASTVSPASSFLINSSISAEHLAAFTKLGLTPLPIPLCRSLSAPVSGHADLLFFRAGDSLIFAECYCNEHRGWFDSVFLPKCEARGLRHVITTERLSTEYPGDILFSAARCGRVGRYFFCLEAHISVKIKEFSAEYGYEIVNVRQGYAGCSVRAVSDEGLITADAGIAAAARRIGLDVLEIAPGHIALPGYGGGFCGFCGFIGGASFSCGGAVIFFGDLRTHLDGADIEAFCRSHGRQAVSLCGGELRDWGSAVMM